MDEPSRLAWEDYRRRNRSCLAIFLVGVAFLGIFCIPSAVLNDWSILSGAVLMAFPFWVAVAVVAGCYLWSFKCPRCHEQFHSNECWARACARCGLRVGESREELLPLSYHDSGKFEWPPQPHYSSQEREPK